MKDDFLDSVTLKDFEVLACHGVNAQEKINPQRFVFTATVFEYTEDAAKNDDIDKTVSYSALKKTLKAFCEDNCFDLIETLAVGAAEKILLNFPLAKKVELCVKKPDAPMSGVFDYAAVSVKRAWHKAYLSLGSNLGDRNEYLDFALAALRSDNKIKNVRESKRLDSAPYGGVADREFLNSAVELDTIYNPYELLKFVNSVEKEGGRIRGKHWGNRTLDIDVIFYDDCVIGDNLLAVPHPDMHNRLFVLEPLNELCPNYVHPLLNKRVSELYLNLSVTTR